MERHGCTRASIICNGYVTVVAPLETRSLNIGNANYEIITIFNGISENGPSLKRNQVL